MFYENELRLLSDTFKKSHVRAVTVTSDGLADAVTNVGLESTFGKAVPSKRLPQDFPGVIQPYTKYQFTDAFGLCYTFLQLPETEEPLLLVIGPYMTALPSPQRILEIGEKNGVSPKSQRHLEEYYASIQVLSEGDHLLVMLDTFCERIWKSPSFAIVDINKKYQDPVFSVNETVSGDDFDDILVSMKAMEKRYEFENELIRAVTLGQIHKGDQLLSAFSEYEFEKRVPDLLRNTKNYCIIMNTLLRKGAEAGGVHPIYLDRISSEFAVKIEHLASLSDATSLMREIFRSYCRLVRKHNIKKFSPAVQKAILLIDAALSADLSPRSLAKHQNLSLGYLSAIFKRETGKTVSEYIREKRIDRAKYLLGTTNLQIGTVALHCGIIDVQYFSKIFKKQTGKTPKEYREATKRTIKI